MGRFPKLLKGAGHQMGEAAAVRLLKKLPCGKLSLECLLNKPLIFSHILDPCTTINTPFRTCESTCREILAHPLYTCNLILLNFHFPFRISLDILVHFPSLIPLGILINQSQAEIPLDILINQSQTSTVHF